MRFHSTKGSPQEMYEIDWPYGFSTGNQQYLWLIDYQGQRVVAAEISNRQQHINFDICEIGIFNIPMIYLLHAKHIPSIY